MQISEKSCIFALEIVMYVTVILVTFINMLERYFRQKAKEDGIYTDIGNFWDRKGEHEIDIVLVNEQEQVLRIGEIKRQAKNIDIQIVKDKVDYFLSVYPQLSTYNRELLSLSMQDM